jgi:hypothetical protein
MSGPTKALSGKMNAALVIVEVAVPAAIWICSRQRF